MYTKGKLFISSGLVIRDEKGRFIADCAPVTALLLNIDYKEAISNTERIVHCVNNFDKLLEALNAWWDYDSESASKHPCPDYTMRKMYLDNARKLTETIFAELKGESHG